jgi:hypothetical protein
LFNRRLAFGALDEAAAINEVARALQVDPYASGDPPAELLAETRAIVAGLGRSQVRRFAGWRVGRFCRRVSPHTRGPCIGGFTQQRMRLIGADRRHVRYLRASAGILLLTLSK